MLINSSEKGSAVNLDTSEDSTGRPFTPLSSVGADDSYNVSVLGLIDSATQAIRSVQRYNHTSPVTSNDKENASNNLPIDGLANRYSHLSIATSSRALTPLLKHPDPNRHTAVADSSLRQGSLNEDENSTKFRKASLDVLGAIKDMETRFRLPSTETEDEVLINRCNPCRDASNSSTEDSESESMASSVITAASGHLYRSASLEELEHERGLVRKWIVLVDEILFNRRNLKKSRTRQRLASNNSEVSGTSSANDSPIPRDLPAWAREDTFVENELSM